MWDENKVLSQESILSTANNIVHIGTLSEIFFLKGLSKCA